MSTLLKSRQRNWIAAACLLCGLVLAAPACWAEEAEKPPAAVSDPAAAPAKAAAQAAARGQIEDGGKVPPQVWEAFLKAFREDDLYRVASQLKVADVKVAAEKWSKELGVQIETESSNLLAYALENGVGSLRAQAEGTDYELYVTQILWAAPWVAGKDCSLTVISDQKAAQYSVPADKLAEVAFKFTHTVRVVHPLNRRLDEFSVQGEKLTNVLRTLAKEAGADYSARSDFSDQCLLTLSVRNRPIQDILRVAADSVGWRVEFFAGEAPDKSGKPDYMKSIVSPSIDFQTVLDAYADRDGLVVIEGLEKTIATPLDAMKYLVSRIAREIHEQRPVLVMQKAAP
jgi:hypothetical protein